jgi:uracil-DNA glycosylase family 4
MSEFNLEELRDNIRGCKACGLCSTMPFAPVPGIGPYNASILIVGEAPGEDESLAEEPFVGVSGRMLNKILSQAGLRRESLYICNAVNCRPVDGKRNRPPTKGEIKACTDWLYKQIGLIKPKVIFTLGKTPSVLLLKEKTTFKLSDHIGKIHKFGDIDLIPNYHPSYVLQQGVLEVNKSIEIFKQGLNYIS